MPETIAFAAASAASTAAASLGASVATQAIVAHAAAVAAPFIVSTAVSVGASIALSALMKPPGMKPSSQQNEVKEPVAPRLIHYGRRKVSGAMSFIAVTSEEEETPDLYKVLSVSAREIDAIEQHYLNGQRVDVSPDGTVTSYHEDGEEWAYLYPHLGTDTQAADPLLLFEFPTVWTAQHTGSGVAYIVQRLIGPNTADKVMKIFPNGIPEWQGLIRGAKLYDPTLDSTNGGSGSCRINDKTTWVWSEEQRLIMLDYLMHPDCYDVGFPSGTAIEARTLADCRIDWQSWIPQIMRGRELVPLKDGGTQPRWRCSTSVDLANEEHSAALARIRMVGDARIFETAAGKIGCKGGAWDAPVVEVDATKHLIDAELGPIDRMSSYNVLRFKYLSPEHDFVEQDGDPWRDEAAITAAGGVEREQEVDLTACPDHAQARRLCKIMTARDNAPFSGTVRSKLYGLQAAREDNIDFSFPELDGGSGDVDGPWWVEGEMAFDVDSQTVSFGLRKANPASYDWDPDSEEGTPPPVPGEVPGNDQTILLDDENTVLTDDEDVDVVSDAG